MIKKIYAHILEEIMMRGRKMEKRGGVTQAEESRKKRGSRLCTRAGGREGYPEGTNWSGRRQCCQHKSSQHKPGARLTHVLRPGPKFMHNPANFRSTTHSPSPPLPPRTQSVVSLFSNPGAKLTPPKVQVRDEG